MKQKEKEKHFTVRVPETTYDKLAEVADVEKRSVNGQINWFLERVLKCPVQLQPISGSAEIGSASSQAS